VTQIPCGCSEIPRAPDGCLQYFKGISGSIKSFNYDNVRITNLKIRSKEILSECCYDNTGTQEREGTPIRHEPRLGLPTKSGMLVSA